MGGDKKIQSVAIIGAGAAGTYITPQRAPSFSPNADLTKAPSLHRLSSAKTTMSGLLFLNEEKPLEGHGM